MNHPLAHYEILADLFFYPDATFPEKVKNVQQFLDTQYPDVGKQLGAFSDFVSTATLIETEELYTRSFDVQAITTLDIGYVMFGDDYKRGELLVNLNREHREAEIDCRNELADHLPNVLRLLPRLKDQAVIDELIHQILAPGLKKMIGEFNPEKLETKNKVYKKHHKTIIESSATHATIYQKALMALYGVMNTDFPIKETPEPTHASKSAGFLKSVGEEMEIEKT